MIRFRVRKDSLFTKIITVLIGVLFLVIGIYELYTKKNYIALVFTIFFILFLVYYHISKNYKKKFDKDFYSERKTKLKKFIQQTNSEFFPTFPDPIKNYKNEMSCFSDKENLVFNDVVKLLKDNEEFYVGELEWSTYEEVQTDEWIEMQKYDKDNPQNCSDWEILYEKHTMRANSSLNYKNKFNKYRYKKIETKNYQTMCVLFDKSLSLPEFQSFDETYKDRFLEIIHFNKYKDIDFESDNNFSESWFLTTKSSENLVRDLFNKQVRFGFNQFKNKNYIISGYRNMLVIITLDPVFPDKYYSIASDLERLRNCIKNNKKFVK